MWAAQAQGAVRLFAVLVLLQLVACLRFRHFQRSVVELVGDDFIQGLCFRGVRKVQGAFPPFRWMAPRFLGPLDLAIELQAFLVTGPKERPCMVPDLRLNMGRALILTVFGDHQPWGIPSSTTWFAQSSFNLASLGQIPSA